MKTLYLIRHAKSSWKDSSLPDIDRPLNSRGKRDAPFMGKVLFQKDVQPDLLVSSPAKRARKTAVAFARALDYPKAQIQIDPAIYEASIEDLFKVIRAWADDLSSVLLFGHNMTYTMLANLYANPSLDNVPTTGIVAIQFEINKWDAVTTHNGQMLFFEYPKKYI